MDINSNQTPSYAKYDTRRRIPNPATAALLVIDVQNHFSSIVTPILPSLNSTISLLRSHRIPIIFTRHRHRHVTLSTPSTLSEWWGPNNLILEGTFDSQLMDGLDRRPDDLVVEKETYSAFRGTELEGVLRGMGVEEVVVVGVMTNLCCETTAREAFVRGFRVFFSTDATGTRDWEMQEATVMNLAYGLAYLVDCGRLKEGLGGKGG